MTINITDVLDINQALADKAVEYDDLAELSKGEPSEVLFRNSANYWRDLASKFEELIEELCEDRTTPKYIEAVW